MLAQAYIQLTEAEATPLDAADAIERRDSVRPRPGPRADPPPAADQPRLAARRDRPRRLRPVPAAGRRPAGHHHRGGGRRRSWSGSSRGCSSACPPGSVGLVVEGGPPRPRPHRRATTGSARSSPCPTWSPRARSPSTSRSARSAPRTASAWPWTCSSRCGSRIRSKFAYSITPGDADQFVQAACQDAVRTLVRGIEAMSALDLDSTQSDCAAAGHRPQARGATASTSAASPSRASRCPPRSPTPSRRGAWRRSSWPSRRRPTRSTGAGSPTRPRSSPRRPSPGSPRWSTRPPPRRCAWRSWRSGSGPTRTPPATTSSPRSSAWRSSSPATAGRSCRWGRAKCSRGSCSRAIPTRTQRRPPGRADSRDRLPAPGNDEAANGPSPVPVPWFSFLCSPVHP